MNENELALREKLKIKLREGRKYSNSGMGEHRRENLEGEPGGGKELSLNESTTVFHFVGEKGLRLIWMQKKVSFWWQKIEGEFL